MQFQATCSKGNKKLTLTLNADSIDIARNILHNQGYSIISIAEVTNGGNLEGNFFYFDAKVNGILQSGKIQSTDIFQSYKKLTEDLKYDVIYIYTNEGMPEESKKIITAKVKDGYRLFRESRGEDVEMEDELKGKTQDQQDMQEISGNVLKEIAKYSTVIDSSIEKIQNIFLKYHQTITPDQKIKLETLENTLIQAKGSKNIGKISNTVENGLHSIGEIELSLLKAGMTEEKKQFLLETNALLKQVGSKDRIESKEDKENSLIYKINNFFNKPKKIEVAPVIDNKPKKDANSFIYFKNKRELDIYKKKNSSLEIEIIKKIFTFQFSQIKKLLLKKKLILQNIEIIDNRINNRVISYTQIVHGLEYYNNIFYTIISTVTNIFFYILFIYTSAYIGIYILNTTSITPSYMDGKGILYIVILSISTFFLSYIRNILTLVIIFPILSFLVYFLSINF